MNLIFSPVRPSFKPVPIGLISFQAFLPASLLVLLTLLHSVTRLSAAELTAHSRDQIEALQAEKAGRTPTQRKLDSQLLYAGRQERGEAIARGVTHARLSLRRQANGRVMVDIQGNPTQALVDQIERGGGTVLNRFARQRAMRAWVPMSLIETLAGSPDVQHIRPAAEATTNSGTIDSEGDVTHLAAEARQNYVIGGEGIKIGVLSDSVDYLADSQTRGELPADVTVLPGQAGTGGKGEGTAMLELIHDLAPASQLYFATAFNGEASFAQNIRDLYAAGCRVIVDDVSYFRESPFQDDLISQAVLEVSAGGALYFSAAGNSGNKNDGTAGVWEGDFADGGPATVGRGGRVHDFGGSTVNPFVAGGGFRRVDLFWADPLGQSANDYDVYVLDAGGQVVASSTNVQNGNDDPYESIPNIGTGDRIVVVKFSGQGRYLRLATGRGRLAITTGGAVTGHNASSAPNAFSVGATWVHSPAVPFTGGPANPTEPFSSDGPRHVFFNPDGSPITPGNSSSSGGRLISKPDLTAADGISTSVPGFETFFGTSAAAPHAAAIAALVWSYNPALEPAQVRAALVQSALDIESGGPDYNSGAGIVMAPAAIEAAPAPPPRLVHDTSLIEGGNGNGTFDPNECNQVFLRLRSDIGANGATATGIRASLRSLTAGVTADPLPVDFRDAPASGTTTNALPFLVSTQPGFVCGTPVVLELSIEVANGTASVQQIILPSTTPSTAPAVSFTAGGTPVSVPDLSTVDSTVGVSGIALPVSEVTVSLHLTHSYISDLVLSLIGPDGTTVQLSSRNGNGGQNYGAGCASPTIFDDLATNTLTFGTAPFAGRVQPQESLSAFHGKSGAALNGTWTLRVSDVAEPDSGAIQCWTLNIAPIQCLDGGGSCFSPPTLLVQPQPTTATNGLSARFTVTADGTPPFTYQWLYQGTNAIPEAAGPELLITSVSPADAGYYSVTVSNRFGSVTSDAALLTVVTPPAIATQPLTLTATNGTDVSFSVVATGSAPLRYQWYRNGNLPLAGATQPTLLIPTVSESDAGDYSVVVSNPYGTATSTTAVLNVIQPPSIQHQPAGVTANKGASISLTVSASGTQPLHYQWYLNQATLLAGATNATLLFPSLSSADAGSYHVVVSNPHGTVTSAEAVVTVVVPNQSPLVVLNSPASGQSFAQTNLPVTVSATATDADGTVARVEFYVDGALLLSSVALPHAFDWIDPLPGSHRVWAVAVDNLGARGTSSVAQISVPIAAGTAALLVPTNSVWKYLDDGSNQGTAWTAPGFNDSSWASGPAELGYGDSADGRPEATVIGFGPNTNSKYITYYFRRQFLETDAASYTNLLVRLMRDDGGVVYLNGVEIFRSNMPAGTITYTTLASSSVGTTAEYTLVSTNVPVSLLQDGTNTLAVEIHQNVATSTDISFDLELSGSRRLGPRLLAGPTNLTVTAGQSAVFASTAIGVQPLAYQWFFNRTSRVAAATNSELQLTAVATNRAGLYSVVITNLYGTLTSAPASLVVVPTTGDLPPTVTLSSPVANAVYDTDQLPVRIAANASDADGQVTRVDFLSDGRLLASVAAAPFQFDWLDPRVGVHRLTAVATDNGGLSTTSAVVQLTVNLSTNASVSLVRSGAIWRYNDTGSDLGSAWTATGYNDSEWASGPAELGYGDAADGRPEATVISYGPDANAKYPTAYFRGSFTLTDPGMFNGLRFSLLEDDGAAVYLNGVEVFRDNLPSGTILFSTLALTNITGAPETNLVVRELGTNGLRAGLNILAVEMHQSTLSSSDLSFDLAVEALIPVAPQLTLQPLDLTVPDAGNASFSVSAWGAAPLSYQWYFNQLTPVVGATNATLLKTKVSAADAGTYRCVVSNRFGSVSSSNATLVVLPPVGNLPPTVALTAPASGAQFDLGTTIPLTATASDPDGQVASVQFLADGILLGSAAAAPYRFDWAGATAGAHTLVARATDNLGLTSTSAPVTVTVVLPAALDGTLIQSGSVWRYLDSGVDQGTTWRRTTFNDSAWKSGPALLGYGNAAKGRPEATVLSFGPNPASRYPTYYFRRAFVVTNLAQILSLELRLLRDDGAAVYLNNTRIVRDNLPNGTTTFAMLALTNVAGADETRYFTNQIATTQLVAGTNVLAVEVHQSSLSSDDLAFDLSLRANLNNPPTILTQPSDITVTNGGTAVFNVAAAGSGTLSYQWYQNGATTVSGGTQPTLTLSNVTTNRAGLYSVAVHNTAGSVTSSVARLTVVIPTPNVPPSVSLSSPTNNSAFVQGSIVTLSATATDSDGTIASVGFYDGTQRLALLTNSPFVFDWLSAAVGTHQVRALATDNRGGTNLSPALTITVTAPPPPPSLTVSLISTGAVWRYLDTGVDQGKAWRLGSFNDAAWKQGPAELGYGDTVEGRPEATLLGYGPDAQNKYITYYFRHSFEVTNAASFSGLTARLMRDDGGVVYLNGTEVFRSNMPTGAVGYTTLASSAVNKQFEYTFYETNVSSSLLLHGTNVIAVEIHQNVANSTDLSFDFELLGAQLGPPVIVSQPQSQSVPRGGSAQFAVVAVGASPLSYQWFFNGLDSLPNDTNATLVLPSVTAASEGSYSVVVSNVAGVARSVSVVLTVIAPPTISTQPQGQTVGVGADVDFTVGASGAGPLTYQWLRNNSQIAGATNATLHLASVQSTSAGSYTVRVSNPGGSVVSGAATLTVVTSSTPLILSQPQGLSVFSGSPATLAVSAAGTPPLAYQWFFNTNTVLSGATNASLVFPSASVANMGFYSVRVTNRFGTITSSQAELRVIVPASVSSLVFATNRAELTFPSVSRLIYSVDFKDLITNVTWNPLPAASLLKGTGADIKVSDPQPNPAVRFYRVRVE